MPIILLYEYFMEYEKSFLGCLTCNWNNYFYNLKAIKNIYILLNKIVSLTKFLLVSFYVPIPVSFVRNRKYKEKCLGTGQLGTNDISGI